MKKNIFIAFGYLAFFGVSFLFSFYWTFDTNHVVKGRLVSELRSRGYELEIDELDKFRLSGLLARGVTLSAPRLKAPIKIDELRARLSILPLILGKQSVGFSARLYDGTLSGKIVEGKDSRLWNLEAKNIDLSRMQPGKENSFGVMAKLNGKADLNLSPKTDPQKWRGQVTAGFGSGKISSFSYQGFQVPEIKISSMDLNVSLLSGKAEIKTLELKSPDLAFDGKGQVQLNSQLSSSQIQITGKINPSPGFMEKLPALQALLPSDRNISYNGSLGAIIGAGF